MTGLIWKDKVDHETHLCYKPRSMYHDISNLVKPFFGRTRTGRKVDKLRPLAYSVPPCEE
jgi:hypothetical protein